MQYSHKYRGSHCLGFLLQFGINTADKGKKKTISVEDILSHFKNDKIPEFTGKYFTLNLHLKSIHTGCNAILNKNSYVLNLKHKI